MEAALANTCAEAELGKETAQVQIGTLPALPRKSVVCQCRFLQSTDWLRLWDALHPVLQHVTFSQCSVMFCSTAMLSSVTDKFC